MKIYAHMSQKLKNSLRKKIWDQILKVANLDEEEEKLLEYCEDSKNKG
jgi:hypothetical protein